MRLSHLTGQELLPSSLRAVTPPSLLAVLENRVPRPGAGLLGGGDGQATPRQARSSPENTSTLMFCLLHSVDCS
jgi:hypothetical protein